MNESDKEFLAKKNYQNFLNEFFPPDLVNPTLIEDWIEKTKIIEQLMLNQNRFFLIFSHVEYWPIYFSKNFEEFMGYDPKHLAQQGLWYAFKKIHWSQFSLFLNIRKWTKKFVKENKKKVPLLNHGRYFCGLKFKNAWGEYRSYFLRQKMLLVNDNNEAILSFVEIEDITAIYKTNNYWSRISAKNDQYSLSRFYISTGNKKEFKDLISPKEMDILKLCNEQKSVQEISEILQLSKNTVERHRKNMIARAGVKDLTALIHVCRLCEIC